MSTSSSSAIRLRVPSALRSSSSSYSSQSNHTTTNSSNNHDDTDLSPPPIAWLTASSWNVTYSTLPMWRAKRNVRITYGLLSAINRQNAQETAAAAARLSNLVTYQSLTSSKVRSVRGVDRAEVSTRAGAGAEAEAEAGIWSWHWRGSGWLKIASSRWEILGYGAASACDSETETDWMVTYFARTLFTPAGIDVYSRPRAAVSEQLLEEIQRALKETGDVVLTRLADQLFLVKHDDDDDDDDNSVGAS
ncbi:hypothetical protein VTN96DRAFT_3428 [Rasamsonia emersonii]|uniref:Uncharacterized protein n=1 Tax=Rasamsonia emersonii (strain ATCC 16479 / CBS 393.64 / IMI 116815) TaxID=1408163 RepID=A0A0F4YW74_RASE3|nr:hypothetical protein T310_3399 [Rasamsonia emersonii CBS 393.64]KKA22552.1 hypothetical protein T310_3399 [Rasamsonia emersonii CBS 393.64]